MALLRKRSATWPEHRLYAFVGLAFLANLRSEEVFDTTIADLHLDRPSPVVRVAGRSPVVLAEDAAGIPRQWLARPDRVEIEYLFPYDWLTGRWTAKGCTRGWRGFYQQFGRACQDAGIGDRVILGDLLKIYARCAGPVELGEAWRAVPNPEPTAYRERAAGAATPWTQTQVQGACDAQVSRRPGQLAESGQVGIRPSRPLISRGRMTRFSSTARTRASCLRPCIAR
jgi:hypothetical protein